MSTTPSPDRRFIVALTAAAASATLAVGVTAGSLLGWIGPRTTPGEPSGPAPAGAGSAQLIYVPITPSTPPAPPAIDPATAGEPRFALADADSRPDDRDERREHEHAHGHEEDDDD